MSSLHLRPFRVASATAARTVFLVEDEDSLRKLLRHTLRAAGYATLEAAAGEEAIEQIAEDCGGLDLVVADFGAVRDTEFQARLSRLRPGLPLLLLSGTSLVNVLENDCFAPSVPFLGKPFTMSDLLDRVDRLLRGDFT